VKTFVVVGLGLIGGSLAASIRERFPRATVIGVSRRGENLRVARRKRWIDEGTTRLPTPLRGAHLVLVATPVPMIPRFIRKLDDVAEPGTLVTDVGSTKAEIVRWVVRERLNRIQFVGSHPLAGSHLKGLGAARADLFDGASVFITPTSSANPRAVRTLSAFWKRLRTQVYLCSPELHDRIVAAISHLPHAVVSILMHSVSKTFLRYGAGGFLDTTRIAQSDPDLWAGIFLTNRANLIRSLSTFDRKLKALSDLLANGSEKGIRHFLALAQARRREAGKGRP